MPPRVHRRVRNRVSRREPGHHGRVDSGRDRPGHAGADLPRVADANAGGSTGLSGRHVRYARAVRDRVPCGTRASGVSGADLPRKPEHAAAGRARRRDAGPALLRLLLGLVGQGVSGELRPHPDRLRGVQRVQQRQEDRPVRLRRLVAAVGGPRRRNRRAGRHRRRLEAVPAQLRGVPAGVPHLPRDGPSRVAG